MTDPDRNPDAVCDGGDLDCGSGLLLIIREAMQPLSGGGVLEVRSNDSSVAVDLPAWCRLVGHRMLGSRKGEGRSTSYFLEKKGAEPDAELDADRARAKAHVWRVRARARDGMSARVYVRNHMIDVGQPASFDTEDAAPSAIEYLLASLAACVAVGLRWRATRAGVEIFELEVTLNGRLDNPLVHLGIEDAGHPGLASVEGRIFVDSDADDETLAKLWDETLARSPVFASLVRPVPLTIVRRTS